MDACKSDVTEKNIKQQAGNQVARESESPVTKAGQPEACSLPGSEDGKRWQTASAVCYHVSSCQEAWEDAEKVQDILIG